MRCSLSFDPFPEGLGVSRPSAGISLEPQRVCDRGERSESILGNPPGWRRGQRLAFAKPLGCRGARAGGPPGRWVSLAWIPRPHSVISNPPAHTGGVHFTKATQLPSALVCQPQMSSTPLRQASFSIASSLRLSLPSLRPRPSLSRGRSAPELVQRAFSSYLLAYPPLLVPLHLFLQLS